MAHLVFSCKYLNLWIISLLFCQFILPWATDQSISIPCLKCASDSQAITVPLSCRRVWFRINELNRLYFTCHCVSNYIRWHDFIICNWTRKAIYFLFFIFFCITRPCVCEWEAQQSDRVKNSVFRWMQYCVSQPRKSVVQFSVTQADMLQQDS